MRKRMRQDRSGRSVHRPPLTGKAIDARLDRVKVHISELT